MQLPFRSHELADHHHGGTTRLLRHATTDHVHVHGRVDPEVMRAREGLRAVALSLAVLAAAAIAQAVVFIACRSVALLADLVHNGSDALTAIPLGIAFMLRNRRAERWAGYFVVLTIFASAVVAGVVAVDRLLNPRTLEHLPILAVAGLIGFLGNEGAAQLRLSAGRRLSSPALVADGHHARVDGLVSLGVVIAAGAVAVGLPRADPLVGLAITALILRVTWRAWHTVRAGPTD
jgi:cation diffusion facilitator family transporter